jgi:ubiquinone/menaquinone biosynthesis C-methylase UbiE
MSESDYDNVAEFYDSEYADTVEDIQFYIEYAKKQGSPVLELGCGTGRVFIPIAKLGVEVWGLDDSEKMLAIARTKIDALSKDVSSRIILRVGDMREFSLLKKFNLIMIPFNTFLVNKTKEDREKTLRKIREHLTDNGLLIINIFAPRYDLLAQGSTVRFNEITHKERGLPVSVTTFSQYDHEKQLVHVTRLFDIKNSDDTLKRKVQRFTICYIFRYEMEHLLEKEGFQIVDVFGAFDKKPYDYKSGTMIFVAKKGKLSKVQ